MKRKQINTNLANGLAAPSEQPLSPSTTGAMDDLLTKLRAAAPQARDQRDRRRRARLKDRHQVRIASGQQVPDLPGGGASVDSDDGGVLSPQSFGTESEEGSEQRPSTAGGGDVGDGATDEVGGDHIADRAASMLQGLRGDGEEDGGGGLRMRRRRESADEERARRRNRRNRAGQSGSGDVTAASTTPIPEEVKEEEGEEENEEGYADAKMGGGSELASTPVTVVSPPSPGPAEKQATQTATPPLE